MKILGIWLVIDSLYVLTQFSSSLMFLDKEDKELIIAFTFGLFILVLGVYILVLWLFLFKTDWIIDKLRLDQGFSEDKLEIKMDRPSVLNVAIIVIGGLILVDALPLLCNQVFTYFQYTNSSGLFGSNPNSSSIILYLLKGLIGYLMMTNSSYITNFIESRTKDKNS